MSGRYLTRRRLEELDRTLSAKDKAILRSLWDCRYLCTGQIRRLHYSGSTNPAAGLRAASWGTAKLRGFGLIDILERRVGGVRAGSKSYIWSLTESGVNLLDIKNTDSPLRRRSFEPSMNFMRHTLAVSEVFVQLTEICRKHGLELVRTEMEPGCWRPYTGEDKKPAAMKPDMFAVTGGGEFEDSWSR